MFDKLKNQWGWMGYTTKDLKRTQLKARLEALAYNWWGDLHADRNGPDAPGGDHDATGVDGGGGAAERNTREQSR
jgi:hypothetical protein